MNRGAAREIAVDALSRLPHERVLVDGETLARPYGWVFLHQTEAFAEAGDGHEARGVNGLIVVEHDGRVSMLDSGGTTEEILARFEAERGLTALPRTDPLAVRVRELGGIVAGLEAEKDPAILDLLDRFGLADRGWITLPHWDADLCAVGIARAGAPRQLVYVCTFGRASDRFDFACEVPTGPHDTDYEVTTTGTDVDFETLRRAIERHLEPG